MTLNAGLQIGLYLVVLLAMVKPLGGYMARVYEGQRTPLSRVVGPVERGIYRALGTDASDEMGWRRYAVAILLFNLLGLLAVFALERLQGSLPLNPQHLPGVTSAVAFNTAASFTSNTNWQAYGGETTMSYLTQMARPDRPELRLRRRPAWRSLVAFIRGLRARSAATLGNFWVDLTRSMLYILLPLAIVLTIVLVSQGVIQNLSGYVPAQVVDPAEAPTSSCWPWAPAHPRSRSSSSAPTAVASSTSTRRTRSKIPPACRTSRSCSPSCSSPPPFATPSAEWWATPARAGPSWPR